ncbi:hypothetical protein TWF506_003232 [Arthrobotrys conoides]|uniref:Uncharacterized protein n=1 Tax=Arthrobotrys conoides TaxID=74498 RepID=A0AAN8NEB8_9PEZI
MTLFRFNSIELFEHMYSGGESSRRKPKPERPRLPIRPEDLNFRERPDLLVTYNIRIKADDAELFQCNKYCLIDYPEFWLMFFIDVPENEQDPPKGHWTCPPELEWIYQAPEVPSPSRVNMYTMLRYPLMEYYGLQTLHFMKYISSRHDSELVVERSRLELLRERIQHVDRALLNVINEIPGDLLAAKMAKPWYKFGKSDYFKPQKLWLGKQLIFYRKNLHVMRESVTNMLDTMFPYGPQKNETEAPLSSWRWARRYEGYIVNIPDWTFPDAFISSLGKFAVKFYTNKNEKKMKTYKEWAPPRRGAEGLRHAQSAGQNVHLPKPINLGDHNRRRDSAFNSDAWVLDWSKKNLWTTRKHFADVAYINTFGRKDEFYEQVTAVKNQAGYS